MSWKYFSLVVFVLALALSAVIKISARGIPLVLHTNLEKLPQQIENYYGENDSFPDSVYDELNADLHLYRHYQEKSGEQIDLYIGYYGTAKGGRTGHNPYACLPAAGWGIVERGEAQVTPSYYKKAVDLNYTVSQKGEIYNIVLHWYQSAGTKILSTGLEQNLQRFKGKVLYNRNDGAYIQISSLTTSTDIRDTKQKLNDFAMKLLELIPLYWPAEGV